MSGDHTLAAAISAVEDVTKEPGVKSTNFGHLLCNAGCATTALKPSSSMLTYGCLQMLLVQDDYYVFMLSDANLAMYGVSPKSLATALMSDPMVNSYAIFIAGEAAAEALKQEMPVGHARTCLSRLECLVFA